MGKIAVLAMPGSRSSLVMAKFDEAGFELGEVTRDVLDRYPAGRLEIPELAAATRGKNKAVPVPVVMGLSLRNTQVAKCLPAWRDTLLTYGFDYWVVVQRYGNHGALLDFPHDDVIDTNYDFGVTKYWEIVNEAA